MELQQYSDLEQVFESSPLRSDQTLAGLVGLNSELELVVKRLVKTKAEMATTLKVFLIGEVKAGKSTLINALVGQEISPTNILEATAAIWEIGYAERSLTTIMFKDGTQQMIDHAEIMSFFGTDEAQLELADKVAKIVVKTNQHQFKELLLIDSPGLATVTVQNAELTKDIMQDVDLALWIFNANHLGQSDVLEQVAALAQLGKPIIAVINKIDETEDSPEKLIRYLSRTAGEYFKEIFALSAYQAVHHPHGDAAFTDYFDKFKQYLVEQVGAKAYEVKNDSIQSTLNALVGTEKTLHESAARKLQKLQQEQEHFAEELLYEKNRLADDIRIMIEQKCNDLNHDAELTGKIRAELGDNRSFFDKAKNPLDTFAKIVGSNNDSLLSKILDEEGDPLDSIAQSYLIMLNEQVYNNYKSRYIDIVGAANRKSIARIDEFQQQEQLHVRQSMQYHGAAAEENTPTDAMETAKTAAVVSAAGGVAAAGYAAVLGASAASVTMGAALATIALPVTLIGAAGGLAYGWWKSRDNEKKLDAKVMQAQSQFSEKIRISLIESYKSRIDGDFEVVERENKKALFAGLEKSQLRHYEQDIDGYVIKLSVL